MQADTLPAEPQEGRSRNQERLEGTSSALGSSRGHHLSACSVPGPEGPRTPISLPSLTTVLQAHGRVSLSLSSLHAAEEVLLTDENTAELICLNSHGDKWPSWSSPLSALPCLPGPRS